MLFRSKDVLLEAINKFTGTVIFVSHDRYFIDRLATRVFEVEGGKVHVFPGNYEDYLWRKEGGSDALAAATAAASEPVIAPVAVVSNGAAANGSDKARRVNPIKLKQMQERLGAIEEEMPQLETAIAETEAALGNFVSAEETTRLSTVLGGLREMQASLTEEWEDLMLQVEEG